MKESETVKLLLKLISFMGIIWGLGWIIYENTFLGNHFTPTNYQNILLVLMSATWLILLLGVYGKEPENKKQIIKYIPQPTKTENPLPPKTLAAKPNSNTIKPQKKRSLVKEVISEHEKNRN